jgi:hypothetical protein
MSSGKGISDAIFVVYGKEALDNTGVDYGLTPTQAIIRK